MSNFIRREVYIDVSAVDNKVSHVYLCSASIDAEGKNADIREVELDSSRENILVAFTDIFGAYLRDDIETVYYVTNLREAHKYLIGPVIEVWKNMKGTIKAAKQLYEKACAVRPVDCISMSRVRSVTYFDDVEYIPSKFRTLVKAKYHDALAFAREEKENFLFIKAYYDEDNRQIKELAGIICDRGFDDVNCFYDDSESEETLVRNFAKFLEEKSYRFDVYADVDQSGEYLVFEKLNKYMGFPEPPYIFDLRSMMYSIGKDMDRELEFQRALGTDLVKYEVLSEVEYNIRIYKEFLTGPIDVKANRLLGGTGSCSYSRHMFILPFEWQFTKEFEKGKKKKTITSEWLHEYLFEGNKAWKCVSFDDVEWQYNSENGNINEVYSLYQMLTPEAFYLTFGEKSRQKTFSTPVRNYRLNLSSKKKNILTLKRGFETFVLKISGVSLRVFRAGMAMLMIETENVNYPALSDINRITEYGQRLSLDGIARYGEELKCAEKIEFRINIDGDDKQYRFATDFVKDILKKVWNGGQVPLNYFPACLTKLLFDTHENSMLVMKPMVENKMYGFTVARNTRLVNADAQEWEAFCIDDTWYSADRDSFSLCREEDSKVSSWYTFASDRICREMFTLAVVRDVLLKKLSKELYDVTFGNEHADGKNTKDTAAISKIREKYIAYKNQLFADEPVYDKKLMTIYRNMTGAMDIEEREKSLCDRMK